MSCNTQLGEHSHNPSGTRWGKAGGFGPSSKVGTILQFRKERQSKSQGQGNSPSQEPMPRRASGKAPDSSPRPIPPPKSSEFLDAPEDDEEEQQPIDKLKKSAPQEQEPTDQQEPSEQQESTEEEGVEGLMSAMMSNATKVESSGEIPDEIPEGAVVTTTATLTMTHRITLPDGSVKTYEERYVTSNEGLEAMLPT